MNRFRQWIATGLAMCLFGANGFGASVILNEYNGVSDDKFLKDGGTDSYFGFVMGNGGDWFELVAVEDVDMRQWSFKWQNADLTENEGWIYLSSEPFWQTIKAGTIITFIQDTAANGGKDTDETIDHAADWWVNICLEQEQYYYNHSQRWLARVSPSADTGHIKVDNDDWLIRIYDDENNLVFGPVGEGEFVSENKGIGKDEVFYLRDNPSSSITNHSGYYDGVLSSFGAPNRLSVTLSQDFSAFWGDPVTCEQVHQRGFTLAGDLDDDCQVGLSDLVKFMDHWLNCNDPQKSTCSHPWE